MNKEIGGPAFPQMYQSCELHMQGMTLRDWFAGKAMCGFLTGDALLKDSDTAPEWLAKTSKAAYEMADAMLKARK